eukprot:sb/3475523/
MTNEDGTRNVAFGHYAGVAGMINVLHGLGLRLLSLGVTSPFLHIGLAHNYDKVADVHPVLANIGKSMKRFNLPRVVAPLTFVFTGSGNVSQGTILLNIEVESISRSYPLNCSSFCHICLEPRHDL